jgi:hypothetical protein
MYEFSPIADEGIPADQFETSCQFPTLGGESCQFVTAAPCAESEAKSDAWMAITNARGWNGGICEVISYRISGVIEWSNV